MTSHNFRVFFQPASPRPMLDEAAANELQLTMLRDKTKDVTYFG